NDVLLSVDGKPALSAQETMDQVAEIRPGSVVNVQVLRNDKKLTFPVTIQEFPDSSQ
ncbi:PDZ domain-containing protein, partial [Pantoea ananatis]